MLELETISAAYQSIPALKNVSLRVPEGQIVSIVGANGAGKSTLLKAISGLASVSSGRIRFLGQDITGMPAHRIVARGICQVPEGRQIFAHLTVADNLQLGAFIDRFRRDRRAQIAERTQEMLHLFPVLGRRANQLAGTLSGGEKQMLAIARALMARPRLLLLDEPSMGLAPLIVKEIFAVIARLNQQGTTILLVEQNVRAALQLSHYGYVLETGTLTLEGPAADLIHDDQVRKAYLGTRTT